MAALRRYNLLPPHETSHDRYADLARHVFGVPTSVVSIFDEERERFTARWNIERADLPIATSFGVHVLQSQTTLIVEDARADARFAENPLVTGESGVRFYAGAPIFIPEGTLIGTIAVMDTEPRRPAEDQVAQLRILADLIQESLPPHSLAEEPPDSPSSPPDRGRTILLDEDGFVLQSDGDFSGEWAPDLAPSAEQRPRYLDVLEATVEVPNTNTAQTIREGLADVLQGAEQTFETVYPVSSSEQNRWVHLRAMHVDHSNVSAVVTHQNVTDLRRQEQRRRVLETAVEQAQESVLITEGSPLDEPGPRITYVNPAFTSVTGYQPEEVIGRSPRLLQGPDTESWVLRTLRDHLERGEPFEGEAINYRKDGTPYVNHWSIAPVRDENGTLTHWVSVQRDVTDKRKMEKRLLEAQERERRRIAHEMHEEMGGILAFLQMAVDSARGDQQDAKASFTTIEEGVNHLSSVVRQLTERLYSRVLEDYGLAGALSRLVSQFREREELSIQLRNEIPPDADLPSLLENIAYRGVHEALTNVAHHAKADQVHVLVNREEKKVRIHIIDDGMGFNPATQLSDDEQHGLLSLKERIVRLNGKLEIDSAPGDGTRVSMTLPVTLVSVLEQNNFRKFPYQ